MRLLIKRLKPFLSFSALATISTVSFIYMPIEIVRALASSVFFSYMGSAAGAAADITIASICGISSGWIVNLSIDGILHLTQPPAYVINPYPFPNMELIEVIVPPVPPNSDNTIRPIYPIEHNHPALFTVRRVIVNEVNDVDDNSSIDIDEELRHPSPQG